MPSARYEEIGPIDRAEAEYAADSSHPSLYVIVLSVALHEPDRGWAEEFLLRTASHPDAIVRGNAVLGFGHLARLHRELDLARVGPVVTRALTDADRHVRSHAESARDDIEVFLRVRI